MGIERLHLVDGTYELFRAHYSKRPDHRAADGSDAKATVGFTSSMLRLLADPNERVTHIGVAFDNPIESFRNELFDGYKTGEGIDPALYAQFDRVEAAARALGLTVWSMNRYEADDALATAARRWRDEVGQVRILTPDKDLGQCVRGQRVVQVDLVRQRVLDEAGVQERSGVPPALVPDLLALVGDDADGIPGLAGFGARTAAALLTCFPGLDAIPDDPALWQAPQSASLRGAPRLAAVLREQRAEALLYKRLATLDEHVPLPETLADLEWRGVPRDAFLRLCLELDSDALRTRPTRWA
jgi:5'-3' exonuclease